MTKLITARARKNIRTARMLANARKDHSIPLQQKERKLSEGKRKLIRVSGKFQLWRVQVTEGKITVIQGKSILV